MKKLFTLLGLLICFCTQAQLIKFSELPAATTLGGTEIVPGVQSSVNRKISINQVKTFVWDLSPTISTVDTIGFVLVRRTSDGKIFKRSVSSLFTHTGGLTLNVANDFDIDVLGDVLLNNVAGTSGEFIGNVDGHLVWAVPPGGAGGSSSSAVLDVETTQVGNVGSGEDVLYTYTLPADTLNTNGEFIRGRISGIVANNANLKSIVLTFGATDILSRNTTTPTIGQGYTIDWECIRTGATTQKCNATFSGSDGLASAYYTAAGETLSGTVAIVLTGEATSNDDIIKHSSVVTFGISAGGSGGGDVSLSDFVTSETPTGTVNGINDTFTLANPVAGFLHFYINGLLQEEGGGNDYTFSVDTITTTSPPVTGSILTASYIK